MWSGVCVDCEGLEIVEWSGIPGVHFRIRSELLEFGVKFYNSELAIRIWRGILEFGVNF